jgi:iron complex outermembrane recepter protein
MSIRQTVHEILHPRRRSSSAWLSVLGVALCSSANAQSPEKPAGQPGQEVEEVIVTGIRQSLQSSAEIKRNSLEVVDSITAEDIGKLPDPNVAETMTRIPGVQAYRYGGEGASPVGVGSGLTIRGLSGQTASRVDGRAYFTAGGREFNIEGAIPGMISGVDVYKNPTAEHIEGGIGGLVNIRTRRPLDFDDLTVSIATNVRYNDLTEDLQPEIFGLFSNRWELDGVGRSASSLPPTSRRATTVRIPIRVTAARRSAAQSGRIRPSTRPQRPPIRHMSAETTSGISPMCPIHLR